MRAEVPTEALISKHTELWREATSHPFLDAVRDGTLAREAFDLWLAQDAFFLESFARAYALALAHSPDQEGLREFAELISGILEELGLHRGYAERWDVDLSRIEPAEATLAYTDFLLSTAAVGGGVGLTCAAMTPCMRLYAFLGNSLAQSGYAEDNPYAEWIQTYSDPEFESLASKLESLLNRYGADSLDLRRTYRRAMHLEVGFFEAGLAAGRG